MSILSHFDPKKITIFAPDGSVRAEPLAVISESSIATEDVSIHVEPGDEVRRPLPNGRDEVFIVTDVQYSDGLGPIPPSYKLKVRRQGALPHREPSTISVSGPNSRVTIGHDASVNVYSEGDVIQRTHEAIANGVEDNAVRAALLSALNDLKSASSPEAKAGAYQRFIANAANHMTLITPFLPALTLLIS